MNEPTHCMRRSHFAQVQGLSHLGKLLVECENQGLNWGGLACNHLTEPTGPGAESVNIKDDFLLSRLVGNQIH